ncbi:LLM class flavin-dependent oxidoreductase [Lutibaculum baratangense]|uniref:Alkanal monooxygenase alpha chain n=1 Tax=Lutibaculum baratangense AMV1 TaxID=631454 RepID=V4QVF3_9HYPH|nr:LLM class flavin-dependent oxidoreductase [Lutibaculum baratangense]ESR23747.1 Alkanal monooxygenase alpha chain [Lutibaculum baratangense AMV1]
MKFSLFVHMERLAPETPHARLFDELTELVQMAEDGGFHAAWIGEHHGMEFTISPNPFINIAYLGARTSRIRLGTGTVVAPFWHPIKLAGEAALADLATHGRLDVGIARGAYSFEYERMVPGLDAMEAGLRMRELVPAVQKLWQGDYAHDGKYWRFPATTAVPSPLQDPHPPVWVAARDPNSHAFAIANGCNVQVTPLWNGEDEVVSLKRKFDEACAAHPGAKRPQIMVLQHAFVAEDAADAELAGRELSRFYNYFGAWFRNERPIRRGFIETLSEEEMAANAMYAPEIMMKNLIIGTPDLVIDRVKRIEAMGYDQFSFWIDSGMSFERKKASLRRFIDQVLPAFETA